MVCTATVAFDQTHAGRPRSVIVNHMPVTIENQVVLVVGASSGIGRETAALFARVGSRIMASARREERLRELKESLACDLRRPRAATCGHPVLGLRRDRVHARLYSVVISSPQTQPVNPSAPLLDPEVIAAFRSRQDLRDALVRSLETMLRFYGFKLDGSDDEPTVRCSEQFEARVSNWMTPGNRNHLRITRILACLRTLGFSRHAQALFRALQEVYWSETQAKSRAISEESFSFRRSAAGLGKPNR